jgi:hypothetical protein
MQFSGDALKPEPEEHEARAHRCKKECEGDDDDAADRLPKHGAR